MIHSAEPDGLSRHSKNGAGCLILRHGGRSRALHLQQTGSAIIAHSGKNGADCLTRAATAATE